VFSGSSLPKLFLVSGIALAGLVFFFSGYLPPSIPSIPPRVMLLFGVGSPAGPAHRSFLCAGSFWERKCDYLVAHPYSN